MIRNLVRRVVLWAVPEAERRVYVVGDPYDDETARQRARRFMRTEVN